MNKARFAATFAFLAFAHGAMTTAHANDEEGKEGSYLPTPMAERARADDDALAPKHLQNDEVWELERAGLASAGRDRDTLQALGFHPDDPVALGALREEIRESHPVQPWATGDFFLDTTWGTGGHAPYRYFGPAEGIYRGIRAARLSDGTIVALGAVRLPGGDLQAAVTRRNAAGQALTWTQGNPAFVNNGYNLFIPGTATNYPRTYQVIDLKANGNRFYVLATVDLRPPEFADVYGVAVHCFNADGSWCGGKYAWSDGNRVPNHAVALDVLDNRLIVLGRNSGLGNTSGGFWTIKWDLTADGGFANGTLGRFPSPNGYDRSEPVDIAFQRDGSPIFTSTGNYYVLFSRKWSADASSDDFDPCLLAVKVDHAPDTSFPGTNGGVRCKFFDAVPSGHDKAIALVAGSYSVFVPPGLFQSRQKVHVLVDVQRNGRDGFGIWAMRDRADDTAFGPSGQRVYADTCTGPYCLGTRAYKGLDLAYLGADLAIAGYDDRRILASTYLSPMLARIDIGNGDLLQYRVVDSGYDDGQFNSLVVRDSQRVVGIGEAVDSDVAAPAARTQIMIGLTSDDTIYKNGFD
ncbi:MAG: hypothetical protein J0H15_08480 [Xanthomonadales bacterium]|nr:hypothetical protein [Xanthomonadales bacterium]